MTVFNSELPCSFLFNKLSKFYPLSRLSFSAHFNWLELKKKSDCCLKKPYQIP